MWHDARQECLSEKCPGPVDGDGWVIHDYWQYQFTKEQVVRDREAAAVRQANWRAAHNGSSNGVTNGVSSPSPPRPERKRGGKAPPRASPGRASHGAAGDAGQHPFKPDPNGTCETCGLPESNRHHLEVP